MSADILGTNWDDNAHFRNDPVYIFVGVEKRGVLTLVCDTRRYRNDRYYLFIYLPENSLQMLSFEVVMIRIFMYFTNLWAKMNSYVYAWNGVEGKGFKRTHQAFTCMLYLSIQMLGETTMLPWATCPDSTLTS